MMSFKTPQEVKAEQAGSCLAVERAAKSWMKRALLNAEGNPTEYSQYFDCGEVQTTKLADDCAEELKLLEGIDEMVPDWLFFTASEVSGWWEEYQAINSDGEDNDDE